MKPKRSSMPVTVERAVPAESPGLPGKAIRGWAHVLVVFALLLGNLALYHATVGLGFLSVDDPDYVQNNPYIESFSAANLKHIFTRPYSANYAPANLLSYALDVALAKGKSAAAIHLSNVLWHGFVACMVYVLAFTIRPRILPAAAAAALFLLHPAHVEVVAWISSRKDLVATGFAALAMAAYLGYRRRARWGVAWSGRASVPASPDFGGKPDKSGLAGTLALPAWYVASVLAFLLASAGKQSVLLLPAVMLVWDLVVEKRRNWQMLADKVPYGLITLFFGWMTWHAQPSTNQALNPFVMAATQFTNLWLLTGLGQYVLYRPAPNPAAWSQAARLLIIIAAVLVWFLPVLFLIWKPRASSDSPAGASPRRQRLGESSQLGRASVPASPNSRPKPAEISVRGDARPPRPRVFTQSGQSAPSPGSEDGAKGSRPLLEDEMAGPGVRLSVFAALGYWVLIQMVPPMLLAFLVPITDRYLFLPSVGVCLLLAELAAGLQGRLVRVRWVPWAAVAVFAAVWGAKTWAYVGEWRDPRSVWYGAHLKTSNSQVRQFLGEVYQNAGDRVDGFVKSGNPHQVTNDLPLAEAVLRDGPLLEGLRAEWAGAAPTRTNSIAYRDQLWDLAWQQYEGSLARRGTLSTPNLFMCRGRLLVSRGKYARAIPEFQNALAFAQNSSYAVTRAEGTTHALFAIGVAYWNLGNYLEAQQWLLRAQAVQRKSGQVWLPALDHEVERIKRLAGSK